MFLARPAHRRVILFFLSLCGAFLAAACSARAPSSSPKDRQIPFEAAAVTSDGHAFLVSWRAEKIRDVRILASTAPDQFSGAKLVGRGKDFGHATIKELEGSPRWYFELLPDRGEPLVIADRSLHLTTAANFRDAGGYRTKDGRWVRMGLAYRSNGLEHLTDEELALLGQLHIKLVCDLRTAEEIGRGADRIPADTAELSADVLADDAELLHSLIADGNGAGQHGSTAKPPSPESLEERIYRDFVRLPSAQNSYRALFERLADPTELPTVFHCTAGKDRTGWAQAVLLTILGVPRPTIVEDYLLTNGYLQGAALNSVRQSLNAGASSKILANPAALEAAFDQVVQQYGSFDGYLHNGLHLSDATLAALRRNFLAG